MYFYPIYIHSIIIFVYIKKYYTSTFYFTIYNYFKHLCINYFVKIIYKKA